MFARVATSFKNLYELFKQSNIYRVINMFNNIHKYVLKFLRRKEEKGRLNISINIRSQMLRCRNFDPGP